MHSLLDMDRVYLSVYCVQDAGWWLVSNGVSVGFVPFNYVSRIDGGDGVSMAVPAGVQAVHLMPAKSAAAAPAPHAKPSPIPTPAPSPPPPVAKSNPFGGGPPPPNPKPQAVVAAPAPAPAPAVAPKPAPKPVSKPLAEVAAPAPVPSPPPVALTAPPLSLVRAVADYNSGEEKDLPFAAGQLIVITTVR